MTRSANSLASAWSELSRVDRERMLQDLVVARDEWPSRVVDELAKLLHFRAATIRRKPPAALPDLLRAAMPKASTHLVGVLLAVLHHAERPNLLSGVYGALGVEHDEGDVTDEARAAVLDAGPDVAARVRALSERWSAADLRLCLHYLAWSSAEGWCEAIRVALEALGPAPNDEAAPETSNGFRDSPNGLHAPRFTRLDQALIRAVVSSVNGTHGSLPFDELDDMVNELVELNDWRKQSYFHRGFLDSLTDRDLHEGSPGDDRERRAWYLVGFALGVLRRSHSAGAAAWYVALDDRDRGVLVDRPGTEAAIMLAHQIVRPLLDAGHVDHASRWLERTAASEPRILVPVLDWSRRTLVAGDPEQARRVLDVCRKALREAARNEVDVPHGLVETVSRRLAIAWRRLGRTSEASRLVPELLASCTDPFERGRLLTEKALLAIGVRSIEDFELPPKKTRDAFLASIRRGRALLEEAAGGETPVPVACLALSLPELAAGDRGDAAAALDHLRRGMDAMAAEPEFWESTRTLPRCRFYRSVLELRTDDAALAPAAVKRLRESLESGLDVPVDLALEALERAYLLDAPEFPEAFVAALRRWPARILREAADPLEAACRRSAAARLAATDVLAREEEGLDAPEAWAAWRAVLNGAVAADDRDREAASLALDRLEGLAVDRGDPRSMLELFDHPESWERAWSRDDVDDARIRILEHLHRFDEAAAVLFEAANRAITAGRRAWAEDLVERLAKRGGSPEQLETLRARLAFTWPEAPVDPTLPPGSHVSLVVVGGNEMQAAYCSDLSRFFTEHFPGSTVSFELTGWSSNWGKQLDQMRRRIESADAVVVLQFVRTHLGRSVRKLAGDLSIPWIPCSGHGKESIRRALIEGVRVVRETAS